MKKLAVIFLFAVLTANIAACADMDTTNTDFADDTTVTVDTQTDITVADSAQAYDDMPIHAEFLDHTKNGDSISYTEAVLSSDEPKSCILFTSDSVIKEFSVLRLTIQNDSDDDHITFSGTAMEDVKYTISPESPLAVVLTFYGDLPSYGISYQDADGNHRKFVLYTSGENGSLILTEANTDDGNYIIE